MVIHSRPIQIQINIESFLGSAQIQHDDKSKKGQRHFKDRTASLTVC